MTRMRTYFISYRLPFFLLFSFLFPTVLLADPTLDSSADLVIGQLDFESGDADSGGLSTGLEQPFSVYSDGVNLFVCDTSNHRVLFYRKIPNENYAEPDIVIGQPDLLSSTANNGGLSASTVNLVRDVFLSEQKLFLADRSNNRVLIYQSIPQANGAPADVVIGQANFTSGNANQGGGPAANTLNEPTGLFVSQNQLIIAELSNNRVLIYNSIPTSNNAAADVVIGQPDFISNTANNGGRSARSLNRPISVEFDGTNLFVSDISNHRVLMWKSIPNSNFQPADLVLGQPDFESSTANNGGISARTFSNPRDVFSNGKRLFITDRQNHRLLIWNAIPTRNFQPADVVFGQPNFSSSDVNHGGRSARSLVAPTGIAAIGPRLFLTDSVNNRVLLFHLSSEPLIENPQFTQGKAVVGKVFLDWNSNGRQDL